MQPAPDFTIPSVLSGQTVAAALRHFLGNISWSDARRLIAGRRVRINGAVCLDDARRLAAGDTMELLDPSNTTLPAERDVRIVYSDADLVVVNKPAGLQTVRRIEERDWPDERKRRQPVLEEVLQAMLQAGSIGPKSRPRQTGKPAIRVRPVHRLDRDTSGLMLFALSASAEAELVRRFSRHEIQRVYRAVVCGIVAEPCTIDTFLVRDRGDGLRGSILPGQAPPEAQRAITHIRPITPIGNACTLIECRLQTGRTHQIRIHLSEIGHMLCGEKIYLRPSPGAAPAIDKSRAQRQALHSAELEFAHPVTGKPMRFESAWPKNMQRWMDGLS